MSGEIQIILWAMGGGFSIIIILMCLMIRDIRKRTKLSEKELLEDRLSNMERQISDMQHQIRRH